MICRDEHQPLLGHGRTLGAHPCLCHRTGTREGPCLPKEKADVCCQSTRSIAPPSPGSSIALQHSSDLAAIPSRQPRASTAGCKHPSTSLFQGSHSLPVLPTHLPHRLLPGFLWGFPLWGFAPLVLSALGTPPPRPTDPSTSEVTCRPSLQGLYVDTTCSSWIPITATTHSGLSSGQKHISPQITVICTPVLNPPRLQAS